MSELDLLCQAIQTQETVESNGVKFVYMDENTIYRFQNNKMKAISKSLLNKARKAIEQQTSNNSSINKKKRKQSTKTKSSKTKQREIEESTDEEDINEFNNDEEEEEYEEPVKPIKPIKQANKQANKQSTNKKLKQTSFNESNSISLDEYYNNKNRMEYMNREMERLTNKITKLKQYKAIVNKITGGGEIDELPTTQQTTNQSTNQTQYYQQKQINDSLFL